MFDSRTIPGVPGCPQGTPGDPQGMAGVDQRWWGLGCRIEDDLLITESGVEVLSGGCPKHVEEINKLLT